MQFLESKWWPNDLEGQGQWPHFQYQLRISQDACLVQIWWFKPKFAMSYPTDKLNFVKYLVKMTKMTLKVSDLHSLYQPRVSQDACLVQIWWFKPKFVMSYSTDKLNFVKYLVKMTKMTLKVSDLHSLYQPIVSQDACLVQIWWF